MKETHHNYHVTSSTETCTETSSQQQSNHNPAFHLSLSLSFPLHLHPGGPKHSEVKGGGTTTKKTHNKHSSVSNSLQPSWPLQTISRRNEKTRPCVNLDHYQLQEITVLWICKQVWRRTMLSRHTAGLKWSKLNKGINSCTAIFANLQKTCFQKCLLEQHTSSKHKSSTNWNMP